MTQWRPGFWCWVGLFGYVALVDTYLIKKHQATLSEVWGDGLRHPLKRIPLMTLWIILTLHLFGEVLPKKLREHISPLDPIGFTARAIEKL